MPPLEEKENQKDDQDQENDSATYVHRNPLSFAPNVLPRPFEMANVRPSRGKRTLGSRRERFPA